MPEESLILPGGQWGSGIQQDELSGSWTSWDPAMSWPKGPLVRLGGERCGEKSAQHHDRAVKPSAPKCCRRILLLAFQQRGQGLRGCSGAAGWRWVRPASRQTSPPWRAHQIYFIPCIVCGVGNLQIQRGDGAHLICVALGEGEEQAWPQGHRKKLWGRLLRFSEGKARLFAWRSSSSIRMPTAGLALVSCSFDTLASPACSGGRSLIYAPPRLPRGRINQLVKPLFETFHLPAPAQTPLNEIRAPLLGPLRLPTGVWESLPPLNTGLDSAWGLLKSKSLARGA